MSHDLKQLFTMVIGFFIGLSMATILAPSNLALAIVAGIICGVFAGAFYAQVSYGDVFWHVGESVASAASVKQPSRASGHSATGYSGTESSGTGSSGSGAGKERPSSAQSTVEKRTENQSERGAGKSARKNRYSGSFSNSRFCVMITGSNARQKKCRQKERSYWISHQRSQTFIPGRQEQQGRRYQRRVKPREGLRIDS